MDLLDRLLGHDAWTTGELLVLCGPLTDEQLDRQFDIAHHRAQLLYMLRQLGIAGLPEGDVFSWEHRVHP